VEAADLAVLCLVLMKECQPSFIEFFEKLVLAEIDAQNASSVRPARFPSQLTARLRAPQPIS
jgi:hypothetical protein